VAPIIVLNNLFWQYEGQEDFALREICLKIEESSFTSIIGPNEAGKTTLVSCIRGLIPRSYHGILRGSIEVLGKNIADKTELELAKEIGFVFADPEAQFTAMTVLEELAFGMENIGFSLNEIKERLEWVTEMTNIQDLLDKSPFEISGGQKQRITIASMLALKPKIFILDEPTSMLDPLGKDQIINILTTLKEQEAMTLIVVEHNIEQIAPLSDQIVLMADGKVLKSDSPQDFFCDIEPLERLGIAVPHITSFASNLLDLGLYEPPLPLTIEQAIGPCRLILEQRGRE